MSNYYSDNINNALNEIYASINTISERFNNSVTLNNQYMEQIQQIQNKLNIITQNEQNNQVQQQTTNQSNNVTSNVETIFQDSPSPVVTQPDSQQQGQNQVSLLNNSEQQVVPNNPFQITDDQYQNQRQITDQQYQNQLQITDQQYPNQRQITDQQYQNQSQQNQLVLYSPPNMEGLDGGYARKKSSKKKRLSFKQKTVKRRNHKKGARKHS